MTETSKKRPLKERLTDLLKEYGVIALPLYLLIFACVFFGFVIAIRSGFEPSGSAGSTAGTFGAAWLATKITQPLRIGATLVLTPLIAKLIRRRPSEARQAALVPGATLSSSDEEE